MKGTMVTIALVIGVFILLVNSGCSKPILKMEADVATFMKDNTLSVDCKAGIAAASVLAPNTDASVRIAAEAVQKYANKESQEYKDCYTKTAFFSFAMRGGADEIGNAVKSMVPLVGGILP